MFDDLIPQPDISPTQRAFLTAVRGGESGGRYNVMHGGKTFDNFADHPRQPQPIMSGPNAGNVSTAAGADQFLARTWDEAKNALGLPDFSPKSQDRAAVWLAERDYKTRTGRNLWEDIESAKDNPGKLNYVGGVLSKTWTSLPGGAEPNRATGGFGQRLATEFSAAARQQPAQAASLSFDDLIPQQSPAQSIEARSGEFAPPANAPALQTGLNQQAALMQAATRGPAADPLVRQSVEFQNQQIAGGQGTTPIMDLQAKNLITDQVFENDAGMAVFRDPATGQLVEADKNRHVILRDPADNRLKVFARSEATNESQLVSGSRVLAPGLVSGAPTVRAAIPAMNAAKPVPAPTREAIKEAAKEGFDTFRNSGVEVPASRMKEIARVTAADLNADGFFDVLAPKTFGVLSKLEAGPDDAVTTAAQLHAFRRALGKIAGSVDETEKAAASVVMSKLDEFLGTIPEAQETLKPALGNYAAAKRSEMVESASSKADLQAASGGSGANIDNATRQQIKAILNNPKKLRGFSPEEVVQMQKIVRGTPAGNTARLLGKLAPTGVVSGALSGGSGFMLGGGAGAIALPVVGSAAKWFGDVMTARHVQQLDELVRSRSPLAKQIESSLSDWNQKANALADVPSAPKVAQFALATRNLVNNLKDAGISVSPSEFMKAFQGPVRGRADDEQPKAERVIDR